jgi:hypothetical protein
MVLHPINRRLRCTYIRVYLLSVRVGVAYRKCPLHILITYSAQRPCMRPTIDDEVADRVEAYVDNITRVDASDLSFNAQLKALLDDYGQKRQQQATQTVQGNGGRSPKRRG